MLLQLKQWHFCLAALRQAHGLLKKSVAQWQSSGYSNRCHPPGLRKNTVEKVRSELGQITALAYNANGFGRGGFLELDPQTVQQSFEVGAMGAVYLGQRSFRIC
jgi:NAD(P)-dependent dehydrogenase (short-subunit alcohol dehydrogenase family)